MTSISIPKTVTTIGAWAFQWCTGLERVNITNLAAWCSLNYAYDPPSTKWINPLTFAHHLYLNGQEVTELTIPSSITSIHACSFDGCTGLISVIIPETITEIGTGAFKDCSELQWIECQGSTPPTVHAGSISYDVPIICASDQYLMDEAWSQFNILAAPHTPTGTTFEHDGIKYEIISVNDLTCRVYAIDDNFSGNLTIPENVEYKGRNFTPIEIKGILIKENGPDVTSITIPTCVTSISNGFVAKSSLNKVTVNTPTIKNKIFIASTVDELYIPATVNEVSDNLNSNSIGKITIADSQTALTTTQYKCANTKEVYLGRNVSNTTFKGLDSLESVIVSENVSSIGSSTFANCPHLRNLTFKDGKKTLAANFHAFDSIAPIKVYFGRPMEFDVVPCESMEIVEFGENISSIGEGLFKNGEAIRTVVSYNVTPPTTDDTFANSTYIDGTLYVPKQSVAAYKKANGWKNFWEVKSLEDYSAGINDVYNDTPETHVSVNGRTICVSGNMSTRIVSINGTTIYNGNGEAQVDVMPGVYIVVAGTNASKLIVK
jgi:hypothetical protein